MQRLTDLLTLSTVQRWSIVPHVRPQSVADHVFRVMAIATQLAPELGIEVTRELLMAILHHDAAESRTGDIPTPAKEITGEPDTPLLCPWYVEIQLTPDERRLLRISDLIEAYTYITVFGQGQRAMRVSRELGRKIEEEYPREWGYKVDIRAFAMAILREEGR